MKLKKIQSLISIMFFMIGIGVIFGILILVQPLDIMAISGIVVGVICLINGMIFRVLSRDDLTRKVRGWM
jgi:uncharacterized membrane protein HdeD (DUF308 family)